MRCLLRTENRARSTHHPPRELVLLYNMYTSWHCFFCDLPRGTTTAEGCATRTRKTLAELSVTAILNKGSYERACLCQADVGCDHRALHLKYDRSHSSLLGIVKVMQFTPICPVLLLYVLGCSCIFPTPVFVPPPLSIFGKTAAATLATLLAKRFLIQDTQNRHSPLERPRGDGHSSSNILL